MRILSPSGVFCPMNQFSCFVFKTMRFLFVKACCLQLSLEFSAGQDVLGDDGLVEINFRADLFS